jgi:hypothetical protein
MECRECGSWKKKKQDKLVSELEYLEWWTEHDSECLLTHETSSSSMEKEGINQIYERSIEKHNIRYRPYIGDGDSSSFHEVELGMPYGALYPVEKEECVNHITKRMGTNLRELLRMHKGKKLADGKGLGGKGGGLTLTRVDSIQSFYGKSIRENKGMRVIEILR